MTLVCCVYAADFHTFLMTTELLCTYKLQFITEFLHGTISPESRFLQQCIKPLLRI